MIFIFNADGTVIKNTPEQLFQGSSRANTIYFISPIAATSVVAVGFNLPDNTYTPKYLMELTEQTGLTGTFDIHGNVFNMWAVKIPSAVTSKAGTVGVQFFVSSNGSTQATARVNVPIEQGVFTLEPEDEPGYNEVLEALSVINGIVQDNTEAIDDLDNEKADKVIGATEDDFASLDSNGNLVDSGKSARDFALKTTEINGQDLSGDIILKTDNISDSGETNKYVTAAEKQQISDNATEIARIDADYGRYISLLINSSTYVLTVSLYNNDSVLLDSSQVDLPLESMVVSGSYDSTTKSLILTLQSGSTITIPVGDLISGLVPDSRTVNGHALSSDVTVTKGDVGLGDVVNTGDSDTPVEDGTTKFTTGGAYLLDAKKADKVSGATSGNFAGLDANGNLTDSGKKASDFSKVSAALTGAATDEIGYITIDGVEKKIGREYKLIETVTIDNETTNGITRDQTPQGVPYNYKSILLLISNSAATSTTDNVRFTVNDANIYDLDFDVTIGNTSRANYISASIEIDGDIVRIERLEASTKKGRANLVANKQKNSYTIGKVNTITKFRLYNNTPTIYMPSGIVIEIYGK